MGIEYAGIKGQAAVDKLMSEKQGHVKEAFYRNDIGGIDLFWGDETAGLLHIINERKARGVSPAVFLCDLSKVVENGVLQRNKKYTDRVNIVYGKKMAVIIFELRNEEVTAVLTAFQQ